jgi:hypothetical protein
MQALASEVVISEAREDVGSSQTGDHVALITSVRILPCARVGQARDRLTQLSDGIRTRLNGQFLKLVEPPFVTHSEKYIKNLSHNQMEIFY